MLRMSPMTFLTISGTEKSNIYSTKAVSRTSQLHPPSFPSLYLFLLYLQQSNTHLHRNIRRDRERYGREEEEDEGGL
jgi:hypothetical protein